MFQLSVVLLLAISVITGCICSLSRGYYTKKVPAGGFYLWFFNLLQNVFCALGIFCVFFFSDAMGSFSLTSVLLGLLLGVANVASLNGNLKALSIGPFSYTTVIIYLSAIIPTLSGLFFGETISAVQYIGIVLMIICIVLSPEQTADNKQKKATTKWLIYCLTASFFTGMIGIIQKVHQNSDAKTEMATLLLTCFTVSALFAAFKLAFEFKRAKAQNQPTQITKLAWILPLIAGSLYAFPHSLNLFLAGKLPSIILFPIVNLTPMIILMVSGIFLFKEKLSLKRWIGVFFGILSTIFVSGII